VASQVELDGFIAGVAQYEDPSTRQARKYLHAYIIGGIAPASTSGRFSFGSSLRRPAPLELLVLAAHHLCQVDLERGVLYGGEAILRLLIRFIEEVQVPQAQ
jgi:hypothetical protein